MESWFLILRRSVKSPAHYIMQFFADEILERTNHSLPVSYVELGRDATIAGDQIDFKFKIQLHFNLYKAMLEGIKCMLIYMGVKKKNHHIIALNVVAETTPPPEDKNSIRFQL